MYKTLGSDPSILKKEKKIQNNENTSMFPMGTYFDSINSV